MNGNAIGISVDKLYSFVDILNADRAAFRFGQRCNLALWNANAVIFDREAALLVLQPAANVNKPAAMNMGKAMHDGIFNKGL